MLTGAPNMRSNWVFLGRLIFKALWEIKTWNTDAERTKKTQRQVKVRADQHSFYDKPGRKKTAPIRPLIDYARR
ncbi:MAG: hypothetical protein BroJett011_42320 [Chloroflexota bacterium]|nr:MAG: hypothetical protein BroJett011_42320 [Chloroflexota bacterium]